MHSRSNAAVNTGMNSEGAHQPPDVPSCKKISIKEREREGTAVIRINNIFDSKGRVI